MGGENNMSTTITKYGNICKIPKDIEKEIYYEIFYQILDLVKEKELTAKQAQKLFSDCTDTIFYIHKEEKSINQEYPCEKYLESISESLERIAFTYH